VKNNHCSLLHPPPPKKNPLVLGQVNVVAIRCCPFF